jgi:aarF domain-containing kinase
MAAQVAGKEVKQRVRGGFERSMERLQDLEITTRIEQATVMAETLGQLKGAVMKAGQLLSLDASDFLPPEAVDVLARLHSQAPAVAFDRMQTVLQEDLGERLARFDHIEPEAAAAASIGQVHRGVIDGRSVAVKIQYPGIADCIDSDLAALRRLAQSWLRVSGRSIDLDETFSEMAQILTFEADYVRERQNLERYGALLADDPRFGVPGAWAEVSTQRVLTMDWVEAQPLHDWIRAHPSVSTRERFGRTMLDLYCNEFFRWGFVQTDPNHGNFLLDADGRVWLLDLGAALEFPADFRRGYVELLRAIGTRDPGAIVDAGLGFGLFDPREDDEARAAFSHLLVTALHPFQPENQPFRFQDEDYAAASRAAGMAFSKSLRYSPPPRRLLFLHRKLGGIFNLLKRLDLTLDLHPYWEQMVGSKISTASAPDEASAQHGPEDEGPGDQLASGAA